MQRTGAGAGAGVGAGAGAGAGASAGAGRAGTKQEEASHASAPRQGYVDPGEEVDAPLDADIVAAAGGWQTRLPVAPAFYAKLIGHKGGTKQEIERDTGTTLQVRCMPAASAMLGSCASRFRAQVPSRRDQNDPAKQFVVIAGQSASAVSEAKTRVLLLVEKVGCYLLNYGSCRTAQRSGSRLGLVMSGNGALAVHTLSLCATVAVQGRVGTVQVRGTQG